MVSQDFIDKFFLKFDHEIHFIISLNFLFPINKGKINIARSDLKCKFPD